MEKIDRLGWAAGFSFTSYGVRVGMRANDPEVLDRLRRHLPPGWKPSTSSVVARLYSIVGGGPGARPNIRRFNLLYRDITRLARTTDLDQIFETLESDLRLYIAEAAQRRLFVHAGVVGWQGRAILFPGRSFSGKTNLVVEMIRAGATYYSDEYAVLDQHGYVHPFLKNLSIRKDGGYKQNDYSIEALGGRRGMKPLRVGLVVVSQYKQGASWRPRQVSEGQGVLELMANTVSVRRQPGQTLDVLQRVVSNAPVVKGVRGEGKEAVSSILRRLEAVV
ncbi:MAG: hypothetical protein ABR556_08525 [Pyrinomonadaceae bacterium]